MAARIVDYYVSLISPYAWLGHAAVLDVARRTGATLRYRPVRIFELFEANGGLPLGKRSPARQRYRLVELQRWREERGLPLNLAPKFFPVDIALADRCTIALVDAGEDPFAFMEAAFRALWAQDRDLADAQVVAELLAGEGFDAATAMRRAGEADIDAVYAAEHARGHRRRPARPAGLRARRRTVLGPGPRRCAASRRCCTRALRTVRPSTRPERASVTLSHVLPAPLN